MSPPAADLLAQARAWADDDPDPATRAELAGLLEAVGRGDTAAEADLADRFRGLLQFGTAGLRGALGAGPNRMNRAVVVRAAAGLAAYLMERSERPVVVVGYDARKGSADFARDTCAVVTAAGGRALLLPRVLPTPVLAFAVRDLGAQAGVMVTASHNPPQDNGYKVYLDDGAQVVPPADGDIGQRIAAVRSASAVPRASGGWVTLADDAVDRYVSAAAALVDRAGPRDLAIVHTSLHGVGGAVVRCVFEAAGFPALLEVGSQSAPDPEFPTVAFPNPEEPGAIDAALELAAAAGADLVLANDPDADRCAAAVPDPSGTGWRMLRGDEVGALLGSFVLRRGVAAGGVLACSIVSSRLLGAMCAAAGVSHAETLTGFKWIARVPELVFGYEEAIGYCVDPARVRDKDGITAALLLAELAAAEKLAGRTLLDGLDDLAVRHGVYATDSFSVRVAELAEIDAMMQGLRVVGAPAALGDSEVTGYDDLTAGAGGLPPTDGLRWYLADGSRVIVRPSGTEPKLKVYLEVIEPVSSRAALAAARAAAADRLAVLASAVRGSLQDRAAGQPSASST